MAEEKSFGVPEGIEKRLAYWARQLSVDKRYPWVGSGLIDDLKCAAEMLGHVEAPAKIIAEADYDL
jgi:hypothetical protein